MYCRECGTLLPEESSFCLNCGKAIVVREDKAVSESIVAQDEVLVTDITGTVQEIKESGFTHIRTNNVLAWIFASFPVLWVISPFFDSLAISICFSLFMFVAIDIIIPITDRKVLINAGVSKSDIGDTAECVWICPDVIGSLYLYKRAKILNHSPAYFIVRTVISVFSTGFLAATSLYSFFPSLLQYANQ